MEIVGAYSTPLASYNTGSTDAFNEELSSIIYKMKEGDNVHNEEQYSMSGPNGYHTKDNFLDSDNTPMRDLKGLIVEQRAEYYRSTIGKELGVKTKLFSWGMIYGKGAHSRVHTHALADMVLTYYCKVPKAMGEGEGLLTHLDPRPASRWDANSIVTENTILPKVGSGIIFPGWLEHYVTPHYAGEDRICIAVNVFVDKGTF